jgi:predicted MFS family arabinose efflux permease
MVLSRATFWPANWAIAAELPGNRGVQAGRLNAASNLGQILGNGTCGFVLATMGFAASFAIMGALGLAAWAVGLGTPRSQHKGAADRGLFDNYRALIRMRVLGYGILCAYLSALPYSLSLSFYPLLLQFLGFKEEASGILIALRAVGGIGAGLVIARFVRSGPASLWPVIAGLLTAIGVGLQPLFSHWLAVGCLLFAVGVASSLMTIYFQVTLGELVAPAMRGSAMALGGLGWGLSHFSTPLIMGLMADRFGIAAGFYVLGAISFAVAVAIALLRPWAFARTALAPEPS